MSKPLEIEIRGSSNDFTRAAREVQGQLNQMTSRANELASAFTGGVIGGGIVAAVSAVVAKVDNMLTRSAALLREANALDIGAGTLTTLVSEADQRGIGRDAVIGGLQSARLARADFAAGAPEAARAFERLGLSLQEIENLKPDELFIRVLDAFRRSGASRENRFALRQIVGGNAQDAFEGFAARGQFTDINTFRGAGRAFASEVYNVLTGIPLIGSAFRTLQAGVNPYGRRKEDLEPLSPFGMANEERARFMAEQNRQTAAQLARSTLTAEEQINRALQERLRLQQLINDTSDPVRRERLRADLLQLNSQIVGLTQRNPGAQGAAAASTATQRPTDALRSLGFDLGRLSSAGPNYPQQLVQQGERHQRTLDEIRTELRKFNE